MHQRRSALTPSWDREERLQTEQWFGFKDETPELKQATQSIPDRDAVCPSVRIPDGSNIGAATLFYDDAASAREAQSFLRKIGAKTESLQLTSWKFQMLESPKLRAIAIAEAAAADLVIIATNDSTGLPSSVKFALGTVLARADSDSCTLVLVSNVPRTGLEDPPLYGYTRQLAEAGGMTLLLEVEEEDNFDPPLSFVAASQENSR